jgi:hypothetical protein
VGAGNISGADVVRALEGMHREVKEGTLRSIARQAGMTWGDFRALVDMG